MTSELKDRVALVTGSSRGIGAAIASLFARAGAAVVVHGRDEAALSAVRSRIEDEGGRAIAVAADLTPAEEIEAMVARAERELGPVDVLVANAGGSSVRPGPIENISVEDWRASVDANLTATFLTVKYVLPGMKERGRGVIITMASAASRRPHPGSPVAYAAAKAGIEIFTQDLAAQAGPHGIRANCLAPETILTERNEQQIPPDSRNRCASSTRSAGSARPRTWRGPRCSSPPTTPPGSPGSCSTWPAAPSWSEVDVETPGSAPTIL